MKVLRRMASRFLGLFTGTSGEDDLSRELQSHIEMQTEDNLQLGMTPEQARRAAVLRFGGVETAKESYRDQRGLPRLEAFARDLRYAFRSLWKNPEFAAAAILSLGLGIGATTAIFSVTYAILLRSLPYPQPARLATVSVGRAISAPLYDTFRREARSIESAALFTSWYFNLAGESGGGLRLDGAGESGGGLRLDGAGESGGGLRLDGAGESGGGLRLDGAGESGTTGQGEPERIPAARVSAGLFELLGVTPELGRAFTTDEDQKGRDNVVLIGNGLWKRRFSGDPKIIDRTLILNGMPYTVIGVMPPGFQFPEGPEHHNTVGPFPPAEMWGPLGLDNSERTCKGCYNFAMLIRQRPGFSTKETSWELREILKRELHTNALPDSALTVVTLQEAVTGKVRAPILVLFGAVTLALLIACVNVANLLLARGLRRREEIAIRLALGATRARVFQQGLTEALALAACSAALALPIAWIAVRGLVAIAPAGIPRIAAVTMDARIYGFALSLALLTAVLFGVAPAVLTARRAPGEALKIGGRSSTAGPSRLRSALVVAEFALSLILLVGSGLLAKSFLAVSRIPLGFRPENVLTMQLSLPESRYNSQRRATLIGQLVADCSALPGVTSAAATSTLPLTGDADGWGLRAEDSPDREDSYVMVRVRAVTPAYFRTLGIRLRAGRAFTAEDRGANPVAILSESAARRFWPSETNPLGRRIGGITIVGIVDDTHASGIDAEVLPYLYLPFWQMTPPRFALAIRSGSDPTSLIGPVKREIWRIDKDQPITKVAVMERIVDDSIGPRRFPAILMTLFAGFALALAAIGIYGVLSYAVAQRTQEIGIRMALGATRWNVVAGILTQAGALAVAGAALGLAAAFRLTPLLRSLLYGVDVIETPVFVGCALLLLAVAVLASAIPARRAAKLDPMTCLHYE
jgi:predicted permease